MSRAPALVVVAALAALALPSGAHAQSTVRFGTWTARGERFGTEPRRSAERAPLPTASIPSDGWESSDAPPTSAVNPRVYRRPAARAVVGGLIPLTLGWAGSIGIALGVYSSSTLSTSGCAQDYANEHWVPLLGSFVGLARAPGCGAVGVGLVLLDVATGIVQLAGTIAIILGITIGEEAITLDGPLDLELPALPWASQESAGLLLGGTF